MALKALQKLRKIETIVTDSIECDCLIVGDNQFAITTFNLIDKRDPSKKTILLSEREISFSEIFCEYPSTIRGDGCVNVALEKLQNVNPQLYSSSSLFYKEGKFRQFGGRSKSESLLWGEEYFTQKYLSVDYSQLLDLTIVENYFKLPISKIKFENNRWEVTCANGQIFITHKLIWSLPIYRFFNYFSDSSELSSSVMEFVDQSKTTSLLKVDYKVKIEMPAETDTLFLPLSYTHEQGHFIGQFYKNNETVCGSFINYIDTDIASEDEIARRIRLLRKTLDKIYSNFERNIIEEKIAIIADCANPEIVDREANIYEKLPSNIYFVHENAPLVNADFNPESKLKISHFMRGFLSMQYCLKHNEEIL